MPKGVYQRKEYKTECVVCRKIFATKAKNSKYCSKNCGRANEYVSRKPKANNRCVVCGKLISPCQHVKYCSRHYPHPTGPQSSRWKGGSMISSDGYRLTLAPKHPRANVNGYVFEHILVWEKANNKPVPKGWIVHHLNGIKPDNRPANLVALPDKKHRRILEVKAKRIQELEALLNGQKQLI